MPKKTALITGITGQDGSYLSELLLNKGYEVHGMVRRVALEAPEHRLQRLKPVLDRITLHAGSLESHATIFSLIDKLKPTSATTSPRRASSATRSRTRSRRSTPTSTARSTCCPRSKIAARRRASTLPRRARCSATPSERPQRESTPFHPRSPYGISKVTGFDVVRNFRESYGIFAVSRHPLQSRVAAARVRIRHPQDHQPRRSHQSRSRDQARARQPRAAPRLGIRRRLRPRHGAHAAAGRARRLRHRHRRDPQRPGIRRARVRSGSGSTGAITSSSTRSFIVRPRCSCCRAIRRRPEQKLVGPKVGFAELVATMVDADVALIGAGPLGG